MFFDASTILAILRGEATAPTLILAMEETRHPRRTSPQARLQAVIALGLQIAQSRGQGLLEAGSDEAEALVKDFLAAINAEEMEITAAISGAARAAAAKYGEASGHPAQLTNDDCFSYACAKSLNAPLLSLKTGFAKTDLGGDSTPCTIAQFWRPS